MRISAAIVGLGTAALLAVGAPAAYADTTTPAPPPSQGPITLNPQDAQYLCNDMLPKLTDRANKLTARINGDASTRGSLAWLKMRAQDQRAKGHTQAADRLDQRATKRQGRLTDLANIQQRLSAFKNANCGAK